MPPKDDNKLPTATDSPCFDIWFFFSALDDEGARISNVINVHFEAPHCWAEGITDYWTLAGCLRNDANKQRVVGCFWKGGESRIRLLLKLTEVLPSTAWLKVPLSSIYHGRQFRSINCPIGDGLEDRMLYFLFSRISKHFLLMEFWSWILWTKLYRTLN